MKRLPLGEFSISAVVYGLMRSDESREGLRERLDTCLAHGITTLDHADIYGGYRNEAILGELFRAEAGLRDRFEIVTKCGIQAPWGEREDLPVKHYDTSRDHIRASVERSLEKLACDRIDLLLIHRPDPFMDADDTGRALDEVVAEGLVRAVGVSNFRPWDLSLLQSATGTPLLANQIELSLGHTEPFTNGDLAFFHEHGVRVMAWSPLQGGKMGGGKVPEHPTFKEVAVELGATPSQVALAFLLAHPSGIAPVIGTNRAERIAEAAGATELELSRTQWFRLFEAARGVPVP